LVPSPAFRLRRRLDFRYIVCGNCLQSDNIRSQRVGCVHNLVVTMTEGPSNPSSERRGDARRTALKSARIVAKDGTTVECRLRNISESGARLELAGPQLLPHAFELEITGMPARTCTLRWVKGSLIGVQFVDQE
jgi:hypothetical protein